MKKIEKFIRELRIELITNQFLNVLYIFVEDQIADAGLKIAPPLPLMGRGGAVFPAQYHLKTNTGQRPRTLVAGPTLVADAPGGHRGRYVFIFIF